MTKSSILVVGATGTFGSRLVRQLSAAGAPPRALVRSREKGEAIASLAHPVVGDLLAPDTLEPVFRGVERVFVLGAPTPQLYVFEFNSIVHATYLTLGFSGCYISAIVWRTLYKCPGGWDAE
jgi:uncharacterized protein YbjT (DUF2867 family)